MSSGRRIHIDKNGILGILPKTADFTLNPSEANYGIEVNSVSDISLTLPNETTEPFTEVKQFLVFRKNTGRVLLVEEAGLTVYGGITEIADTSTTTGGAIIITWTAPNTFYVNGKEV